MKDISKILVVVDSINIEDSSGSKANVAIINNLAESGFELVVYHYTRKNIQLKGIDCRAIKEKKRSFYYFLSRTQRVFQRQTKILMHTFLENAFGFSFTFFNDTNSISTALKNQNFNPDLVLTLSKGSSFRSHYAVLQLPQFHDKWMAYVHDPYPFHFYPKPYTWFEPGHGKKEKFFREVSEKAKYSAFPSLLLKEWMGTHLPNFLKTGVVIPHQNSKYDSEFSELNGVMPSYFDASKFNVLHAGNLLAQRSPVGLVEGFRLFLNQHPEARKESQLTLLGPASFHSQILEGYKKDNPELYIHNGNVAFDIVYQLQKKVSVNVILEAKSEISPFLPGKFPHCVEANKTILSLAPFHSETKRLLGEEYPFWSEMDDVNKIAELLGDLYVSWKKNPDNLLLNRMDLRDYLSVDYLKKVIDSLN